MTTTDDTHLFPPSWPSLSTWFLLLPALHLLVTASYMWGYGLGFGAKILSFFSASDVFAIAVNDLTPVYLVGLLFPVVATITRFQSGTPYAVMDVQRAARAVDPQAPATIENLERSQKSLLSGRRFIMAGVAFVTLLSLLLNAKLYFTGYPMQLILLQLPFGFAAVVWTASIRNKWDFHHYYSEVLTAVLSLLTCAMFMGGAQGQIERHTDYVVRGQSTLACGGYQVVRRLGGHMLAVDRDHHLDLINDACQTQLSVPPPRPEAEMAWSSRGIVLSKIKAP